MRQNILNRMDEELRAELLRRVERDQAARRALARDDMDAADAENLPWLKRVIDEVGWPGRSLVGNDGANAAWLLAQHADRDPVFQRRCLDLLTGAVDQGEASPRNLAYLTDRVLLHEGKEQEYGTQMIGRAEGYVARRLRDPGTVDERRAAVGLGPLAEYAARMTTDYGTPEPTRIPCSRCGAKMPLWLPESGDAVHLTCQECGLVATVTVGGF
jgi:hypothetical protein